MLLWWHAFSPLDVTHSSYQTYDLLSDAVQKALPDEAKANLLALPPWYNTFVQQAKRVIPKRRRDTAALAEEGRWIEAAEMFQHSKNFLNQGGPHAILSPHLHPACLVWQGRSSDLTWKHLLAGAAIGERLQKGIRTSVDELAVFMAGVVIPFMFGFFGPVRPSALISLQHPDYQVHLCCCFISVSWPSPAITSDKPPRRC